MTEEENRLRRWLLWAMISPFLLMSLLSPAVMPARGLDGAMTLVLCSGEGPVTVTLDPVSGEPVHKAPDAGRCDWACAQHAIIDAGQTAMPEPFPVFAAPECAPAPAHLAEARATGLPPATGPPSVT